MSVKELDCAGFLVWGFLGEGADLGLGFFCCGGGGSFCLVFWLVGFKFGELVLKFLKLLSYGYIIRLAPSRTIRFFL